MLTLNDFFCGAGGMGLGFQKEGFEIVGAWDFDKFAVKTYKENVGEHVINMDIREMSWGDIPKASVWSFGFPCQDLSVAGKQAGMVLKCEVCGVEWTVENDEVECPGCGGNDYKTVTRSSLFFEMMRLLDETTESCPGNLPKILVAENVKGLRKYIGVLEKEFTKRGYTAHTELYNSKYWGVPQNRERYFIVGVRGQNQNFSMPKENKDPKNIPKLSSILDDLVAEKYYMSYDKSKAIIEQALQRIDRLQQVHATITPGRVNKRQNGRRSKPNEEEMFTLTAQDIHGVIIDDTFGYDKEPRVYGETSPTLRRSRQGVKVVVDMQEALQNVFLTQDGVAYCCDASYFKGISPSSVDKCRRTHIVEETAPRIEVVGLLDMRGFETVRRVYDIEGLSPTLTASQGGHRQPKVLVPSFTDEKGNPLRYYAVRKLTPKEYGRLQGFPMSRWKQAVSDTQAYKQFGNAVTVSVARAVARNIGEYLERAGNYESY